MTVAEGLLGASNAALSSCALGKRWQNAVDVLTHLGWEDERFEDTNY